MNLIARPVLVLLYLAASLFLLLILFLINLIYIHHPVCLPSSSQVTRNNDAHLFTAKYNCIYLPQRFRKWVELKNALIFFTSNLRASITLFFLKLFFYRTPVRF